MVDMSLGANIARDTESAYKRRRQDVLNAEYARNYGGIQQANVGTRALMDAVGGFTSHGGPALQAQAQGGAAAPAGVSLSAAAQGRLGASANVMAREGDMSNALARFAQQAQRAGMANTQTADRLQRGMGLAGAELNEAGYEAQKGINVANMMRQLAYGERNAKASQAISKAEEAQARRRADQQRKTEQAMQAIQKQYQEQLLAEQQQRNALYEQMFNEYVKNQGGA